MQLCQQRAELQTLAENPCISKLSGSPAPWQCSADASKEMHTTTVKTEAAQGAETLSNPPLLPVTASAPRPALLQHHHQNSPLLLPWLAGLWPYLPGAPVALSSPPTIIWSSELDHQGRSSSINWSHHTSAVLAPMAAWSSIMSRKAFSTSTSFGLWLPWTWSLSLRAST